MTNLDLANGTISNLNTITASSNGNINIISNSLFISSGNISLPFNSNLNFGSSGSISENTLGSLHINSTNDISFSSGNIRIPNSVPVYFGSSFITQTTNGNLQITNSGGDINLTMGGNIYVPANSFIGFGGTANSITSNGQQLLFNGYNGIGINSTNFVVSGNLNVGGIITATADSNFDINRYILPLGTSQYLTIGSIVNFSGGNSIKITTTTNNNFVVGDQILIKNSNSFPLVDGTFNISSVPNSTDFVISFSGGITTNGNSGTVKSNLTIQQNKDVGIQVNYWSTTGNTNATAGTIGYKTGFFGFKKSTERWSFYNNATISNNVVTGTTADIEVNTLFTNNISGFVLQGNVTTGSNAVIGSNFQINGGNINNAPIGTNTAQNGRFTNLSNTVSANFSAVTLSSSLAYTFERYTLSSAGLQTRNPSTSFIVSLFSVSGPSYTSSSGTMPSNSSNIPDGTCKFLVCSSMGIGSSHTIFFGANKLITPNPLNSSSQATKLTFKRQGQSAQLIFDAQSNNSQGSWVLLSGGVYVS